MSSGLALHFPPREHEKAIFFNSVTICKISLLRPSTRTKPATESQKALSCLLDKRRAMYHARQGSQVSCCSNSSSNPSANGSADFPDNELSLTFQNTSSRVIRLRPAKALQERSESIWPVITAAKGKHLHRQSISLSSPHQPKSSFININSEELAEQIVSKTKLRLKRKNERKENSTTNRERFRTFTPILPSSKEHPHRICSQPNITGGGKKQQSLFSGQSRNNKCLPIMEDCSTKSKTTKDADFSSATNFLKMSKCNKK